MDNIVFLFWTVECWTDIHFWFLMEECLNWFPCSWDSIDNISNPFLVASSRQLDHAIFLSVFIYFTDNVSTIFMQCLKNYFWGEMYLLTGTVAALERRTNSFSFSCECRERYYFSLTQKWDMCGGNKFFFKSYNIVLSNALLKLDHIAAFPLSLPMI